MDAEINRMSYQQLRAYISNGTGKVDGRTRQGRYLKEKMRELAREIHYAQSGQAEIPSSLPGASRRYYEEPVPTVSTSEVGETDVSRFLIPMARPMADEPKRTTFASDVDGMNRFDLMRFLMKNRPQVRGYEANGTTEAIRARALKLAMEMDQRDMYTEACVSEKEEKEAPDFEAMSATELQKFILGNRPESDDMAIKKQFPASGKRSALVATAARLHASYVSGNPYKADEGVYSSKDGTLRKVLLDYARSRPEIFADDVVENMDSWSLPKLENRILPLLRSSTEQQYTDLKNKLGV